jgi:hypothetical protein
MAAQTWSVLIVGMAFLLLGVACSPLAWVALLHRRGRWQELMERRLAELAATLRAMETRLSEPVAGTEPQSDWSASPPGGPRLGHNAVSRGASGAARLRPDYAHGGGVTTCPTLIEVPALSPPEGDREAAVESLTQRYAAIWSLAEAGRPLEEIARAAGQSVGEIELIVGLRRKIDGRRTAIPHAPHV